MSVKLLTEHHLEFLSLKGGCRGSSESTLVKMPRCWNLMPRLSCSCSPTGYEGIACNQGHFSSDSCVIRLVKILYFHNSKTLDKIALALEPY